MEFTTGGRFEVRITPADVGKRVSVRRVIDTSGMVEKFTDTVGVLTSWADGVLRITRRSGETIPVEEATLVAGKVVPPAPARRRVPATNAEELDRVAARAWPPVESEFLGGWQLRAAAGFTRRANSALPLGDPGMPLDAALRRTAQWYAARGLPPYVQVSEGTVGAGRRLADALTEHGWRAEGSALMRIGALAPLADTGADLSSVALARAPGEDWLRRYGRLTRHGPEAARVLGGGPSVWFATVPGEAGEAPAAIGRCVVDGRWAGFTAIEVDPACRRRGLASAVLGALADTALGEGASAAYLQVEEENEGAHALYDRLGFVTHHRYDHWRGPV
ncbi:GNAT family N-acetyltransferase [Streptomyces sp. NPDC057654]|uniref:GNAT family N-acetyltransferase n=1 Tax=Streptomyces sp. NPDC057654 TaxID=3346196 RepID=UPI0036875D80